MSDENIQYDVHDYGPVNKYIDDQARLRRSRSTWRYAKSAALIMVAAGILAILLAWAYYWYKKPHRLVSLAEIEERVLNNEERLIISERRLPPEEEVQSNTLSNKLQKNINNKDQEILRLKKQLENNPKNQTLKEEKQKLENEKRELQKKLDEQSQIQTNVIHFKTRKAQLGNVNVEVVTRLHYEDPRNLNPNKITCYIDFENKNYAIIELGTREYNNIYVSSFVQKNLSITEQEVINLRNKKCLY